MASYCAHCGTPVQGNFCSGCGQPAQTPQPPQKTGGLGKLVLIVAGVFTLLLVGGAVAAIYAVHWVKNRAMETVSTYSGSSPSRRAVFTGSVCALLPKEE